MNDEYAVYSTLNTESVKLLAGCSLDSPPAVPAHNVMAASTSGSGDAFAHRVAHERSDMVMGTGTGTGTGAEEGEMESEREARLACYLRAMGPEVRVDLDLVLALLEHILKQLQFCVSLRCPPLY